MYSFSGYIWKKMQRVYHHLMHAYHFTLYADCLDPQFRKLIFRKIRHHEQKLNEGV